MKQTCNHCRALNDGKCDLGYGTRLEWKETDIGYASETSVPCEECPKPMTYAKLIELKEKKIL